MFLVFFSAISATFYSTLAINDSIIKTKTVTDLPNMDKYTLPKDVKPISYDLYLYPNLKTELFSGKVIVDVLLQNNRKDILMHNNGLKIQKVELDGDIGKHETDPKYELLQITLPNSKEIQAGKRQLIIEFNGDMKNRLVGLYSSKYKNNKGTNT